MTGPLLAAAQSAGSIVVLVPAAAVAIAILLSMRMSRAQKAFTGVLMTMTGVLAMLIVAGYGEELFESLLDITGKDVTLTGRTELWAYGREVIAEHPLLGVGYQAFWVQGYGPAEMLWATFGIASRMGFNFHNTYISNAVEIGIVGLAIQLVLLYGAWFGVLAWALRTPRPESAFPASFLTMVICASFGEVSVFFQFSVTSIIVICALVYAMEAGRARRRQTSPAAIGATRGRIPLQQLPRPF
jgi:exopolysaccharide production protein ExoQ